MKLLLPNDVTSKNGDISWSVRSADLLLSDSFLGATEREKFIYTAH
jgi:hypothetical protein